MTEAFGALLRRYRQDARLSQAQLVERLRWQILVERYSKTDISKWEHGRTKPPEDIVESLEDTLLAPRGLLLAAAGYSGAAEHRNLAAQLVAESGGAEKKLAEMEECAKANIMAIRHEAGLPLSYISNKDGTSVLEI